MSRYHFELDVPFKEKDEVKNRGARWNAEENVWYYEGTAADALSRFWRWTPRLYLDVPYDDKDYVKYQGAQWDFDMRKWYIEGPVLCEIDSFQQWLPTPACQAAFVDTKPAPPSPVGKGDRLPRNLQQNLRGNGTILELMNQSATIRGNGRNTESIDPNCLLIRPDVRVLIGNPSHSRFQKTLKHDDVVIVPELFGREDDWTLYYKLVKELKQVHGGGFISSHDGSHLICKEPEHSHTFQMILKRLCNYFDIDATSAGKRVNWYKDSQDWKPFHHDSAAYNPRRAQHQNITVGVSFGATRELAFRRVAPEHLQRDPQFQYYQQQHPPCRMYFPQTNNGVFTFGRDVNINWKHGINVLPASEQNNKGRISIILWGLARNVVDEPNSPPLVGIDGQGPHTNQRNYPHPPPHHHHSRRGHDSHGNHHRDKYDSNYNNKRRRYEHEHRRGRREDRRPYYYKSSSSSVSASSSNSTWS